MSRSLLTRTGTVVVVAPDARRVAEIDIDEARTPATTPVRISLPDGTVASVDAPFRSVPGFEYVIAPAV